MHTFQYSIPLNVHANYRVFSIHLTLCGSYMTPPKFIASKGVLSMLVKVDSKSPTVLLF